jgi:hypothetical protein
VLLTTLAADAAVTVSTPPPCPSPFPARPQFASFERTVEAFYTHLLTRPKESYSKVTQLSVTLASGYIAGVFCALVSQPADTMVSKLNSAEMRGHSMAQVYGKVGFAGLWKGLGARVVMIGTLTSAQVRLCARRRRGQGGVGPV